VEPVLKRLNYAHSRGKQCNCPCPLLLNSAQLQNHPRRERESRTGVVK
jgi:hypothetical protein